jgi:hypothetical protein
MYSNLLAIVIPYRNREEHLGIFLAKFPEYVKNNEPDLKYKIVVAEQPQGLPFIRGLSINVGAICARDIGADNIFIHDVDMIPIRSDHSLVEEGRARVRFPASEGSAIVHINDFFKSGGYNNEYVGWGGEDDEFYMRLGMAGVRMSSVKHDESLEYESLRHENQMKPDLYNRNVQLLQKYMNIEHEGKLNIIETTGVSNINKYVQNIHYNNLNNNYIHVSYQIAENAYELP